MKLYLRLKVHVLSIRLPRENLGLLFVLEIALLDSTDLELNVVGRTLERCEPFTDVLATRKRRAMMCTNERKTSFCVFTTTFEA